MGIRKAARNGIEGATETSVTIHPIVKITRALPGTFLLVQEVSIRVAILREHARCIKAAKEL